MVNAMIIIILNFVFTNNSKNRLKRNSLIAIILVCTLEAKASFLYHLQLHQQYHNNNK